MMPSLEAHMAAIAALSSGYASIPAIQTIDRHKPFSPKGNWRHRPQGVKKLPRNSPCPCGSGRKAKHCCINTGAKQ